MVPRKDFYDILIMKRYKTFDKFDNFIWSDVESKLINIVSITLNSEIMPLIPNTHPNQELQRFLDQLTDYGK